MNSRPCTHLRLSAGNADESWEPVDGVDHSWPDDVGGGQARGPQYGVGAHSPLVDTLLTATERVVAGGQRDGATVVRHDHNDGVVVDSLTATVNRSGLTD